MTVRPAFRTRMHLTRTALLLWLVSLVIIVPLVIVLITSVKNLKEASSLNLVLPSVFLFENYLTVIREGKVVNGLVNSLLVTGISTALILFCSSILGFILTRNKSRLNRFMMSSLTMGLVAPFAALPTIMWLKTLGLYGSYQGLILVYTAMFMPFSTVMIGNFVRTIPLEMDEAAIVDGCSGPRLFFNVALPLLQAPVITAFILNFVWVWNDFMMPMYLLVSAEKWTLPMSVFNFFGKYNHQWQYISANMVIVSVPVSILYLFCQRYIISGMTAGAVKG